MKLVILTSDIIDGVILSGKIIHAGKDVKAIIYEDKKKSLKSIGKRFLFKFKGIMKHTSYKSIKKVKKDLIIEKVDNINSDRTSQILDEVSPDLIIVAGTRKIDTHIFQKARIGAINMHSGILPYYRGADSEFWALYNGEEDKIGVSIHFVDERLDTGDIILTQCQNIEPGDDYKSLRMKNILLGSEKMVEAIDLIESDRYNRIEQDEDLAEIYRSATPQDIKKYEGMILND